MKNNFQIILEKNTVNLKKEFFFPNF